MWSEGVWKIMIKPHYNLFNWILFIIFKISLARERARVARARLANTVFTLQRSKKLHVV